MLDNNNNSTGQDSVVNGCDTEQSQSPVVFPGENESFEDACMAAAETGRALHLTQDVTLQDVIRLRKRQQLTIRGENDVVISGSVHSLFLLNSRSQLILENVHLSHTLESDDHRQVGSAVNLRNKSSLQMTKGSIVSRAGFCCWAVQKSSVRLVQCDLQAPTRSAVVCFGQPTCRLEACTISNAGVHAICARGNCRIDLHHCTISNSAARAVYAYANASVTLTNCHISGTIRSDKAAIEVSAAGGGSASLTVHDCHIIDNVGAGIRIRGPVADTSLGGNTLERNAGGNIDYRHLVEDEEDNSGRLRRDAAGSSFRRGDWWCPKCQTNQVVVGTYDECPRCGSEKKLGRLLTVPEINQCNQGVVFGSPETQEENQIVATWWFDGDDEKGWLPYDKESNEQLEETYQSFCEGASQKTPLVLLCGGKHQVNIQTMEQINVESQFPRLVRRRA
jgi:hypothetical protein